MVFTANIITPDGILYVNMAKMISNGDFQKISEYGFFNLYPFLIVIAQKVFHNWETAGRMVNAILGSLTVIPIFLIVKKLINMKVALIVGIFYIISPRLVDYSADVLREPSFWFFSATALWLALEGLSSRKLFPIILASIFSGLAILTRIEGVSICIIIVLWSLWYCFIGDQSLKRLMLVLIVYIIAMPLIFSPSLFFIKNKLGRWEIGLAGTKISYLITHNTEKIVEATPNVFNNTPEQFRSFLEISKRHQYLTFTAEVIYKFVRSFNVVFFVLFLFGVFRRRVTAYSKEEVPLVIWFAVFFLTSFSYLAKTYYLSTRHGLLMGIPALVWAGIGFYEARDICYNWVVKRKSLLNYSKYTTLFLLLIIFSVILPKTLSSSDNDKIELKRAGLYLKNMGYSESKFTGDPRLLRITFYTGTEFVIIPDGLTFQETMRFIKEKQVKYIMFDERTMDTFPRNLKENLNSVFFEKVYLPQLETLKEYSVKVYKVKDE